MGEGEQVRFQPLDNAADFVLSAARHLRGEPTARDLKYATLHMVAGVEILLKWRLSQEHYSLVFSHLKRSQDKSEREQWDSSEFSSVNASEALRRLRDVAELEVEEPIPGFEKLSSIRNQLVHHGVDVTPALIQANASRVLNFVLSFVNDHCRDEEGRLPHAMVEALEALRPLITDIRGLVEKRLVHLQPQLDQAPMVLTCPECGESALIAGIDENVECLLCLAEYPLDEAANAWVGGVLGDTPYQTMKDGGEWPVFWCPDCVQETLIHVLLYEDESIAVEDEWICLAEGRTYTSRELSRCMYCSEPARGVDGFAMCDSCSEHRREVD